MSGAAALVLGALLVATFVPPLRGGPAAVGPAPGRRPWVDRLCLSVSGLAPLGWWLTGEPAVALLLAVTGNAVAAGPTLARRPGHEDRLLHVGFAVNAACAFLVITDWSLPQWAFVCQQLLVSGPVALRALPAVGAHGVAPANRAWTRTLGAGGGVLALLAAGAVVAGLLPRPVAAVPHTAAPAALVAHPTALPPPDLRPEPVAAVALPSVRARVAVPPTPGDIELAPDGRSALIAHRTRMAVSVLDTRLDQVVTTIPTPQAPPRFVTFCPGARDRAYLSMFDDPQDAPAGRGRNLVGVLDLARGELVATIPVGSRPSAAACSPDGAQLWVPSRDDGRVDVIDTATDRLLRSLPVPSGPERLVFSADGRKVYASCPDANVVAVLDPAAFTVVRTIPVGASPQGGALSPDGTALAVVDRASSEVSVIDTARDVETARLRTGENPQDVAWSADGRLVYTANVEGRVNGRPVGNVSVIDVATGGQSRLVTDDPAVDTAPAGIARSADGATGYVTNLAAGTVTVFALGR